MIAFVYEIMDDSERRRWTMIKYIRASLQMAGVSTAWLLYCYYLLVLSLAKHNSSIQPPAPLLSPRRRYIGDKHWQGKESEGSTLKATTTTIHRHLRNG